VFISWTDFRSAGSRQHDGAQLAINLRLLKSCVDAIHDGVVETVHRVRAIQSQPQCTAPALGAYRANHLLHVVDSLSIFHVKPHLKRLRCALVQSNDFSVINLTRSFRRDNS